jgi:hypothetical protein
MILRRGVLSRQPIDELKAGAFDPETVSAMITAYEEACWALGVADEPTQLRIAFAIIGFATQGERDAERLRDQALAIV